MSDKAILNQLNRIKGQVEGLTRMYQEDRSCVEIVRQITAARNSLGRVARDLLTDRVEHCQTVESSAELNQILAELFKN